MKTHMGQNDPKQRKMRPQTLAQKKKARSDGGDFEDCRPATQALSDLQSGIERSPRMTMQRKQIEDVFGSEIQGLNDVDVAQKERVSHPETRSSTCLVQRDLGDQALVDFIIGQGNRTKRVYDLLCEQVEVAKSQVTMLTFYSGPLENEGNAELATAKERIAETAQAVRGGIRNLPEEASEARATVLGLAQVSSLATPQELLVEWSEDVLAAVKIVALSQAKAAGILVKIKDDAVKMANVAMAENEIHMMRGLLKIADESAAASEDGDRIVAELKGEDATSSSRKEKAGLVATASDALNNASTGIGFGVVGVLDAGNVFSLSTTAAAVLGVIGGVLGVFFGAIGTLVGLKMKNCIGASVP